MRVALVTHALQFAGPPAVEALTKEGFHVFATDAAFEDPAARAAFEAQHPQGVALAASKQPNPLLQAILSARGRLDVLISNDVHPVVHAPIEEVTEAQRVATFEALVYAPFRLLQAAVPIFKRQGQGRIVMITSCRTALPQPGGALPDMARAAANALVRSLAIELAPHGIPVNAIAPNFLYSESYYPRARFIDDAEGQAYIARTVPAGRLGQPAELGELVRYLAVGAGSFHTGSVIDFAGGWPAGTARPT
jgi:NAD(P)-dependent dehydrogenase (short-subunit alcohol dehydrogenase family)